MIFWVIAAIALFLLLFLRRNPRALSFHPQPELTDDFYHALKHGREVAVAGESHDNSDGTPRRDIIAQLWAGEKVRLEREKNNRFDANAIRIISDLGMIGYVNREDAVHLARSLDRGEHFTAYIASIAGGPENGKHDYGMWLRVIR